MQRVLGKENGLTKSPKDKPIVVIGGGIGGLVSALDMAIAGLQVILVEKEQKLGGKIRQIECAGKGVDSGPTVFTMRWVFDGIFQNAGCQLEDVLHIDQLQILARHAWICMQIVSNQHRRFMILQVLQRPIALWLFVSRLASYIAPLRNPTCSPLVHP
jgi:hypothetical protein